MGGAEEGMGEVGGYWGAEEDLESREDGDGDEGEEKSKEYSL